MPVNLNPPPLPTAETARAATDGAGAEAPETGLFAQLLAAAETPVAGPPDKFLPAAAGRDASESESGAPTDPAAAPALDWAGLAFAPMPMPIPVSAPPAADGPNAADAPGAGVAATPAMPRTGNRSPAPEASVAPGLTPDGFDPEPLASAASSRGPQTAASHQTAQPREPRSAVEPAGARAETATIERAPEAAPPRPGAALAAPGEAKTGEARPRETGELRSATGPAAATVMPSALPAPPDPVRVITVDTPVGNPGWADELTGKLAHVVLRNERVEIRLSPAELGPVDIRVDLRADQASVTIIAAHPATRDALEQALPQLRETLAAQGIALGQASVHDGRGQGSGDAGPRSPRDPAQGVVTTIAVPPDPVSARVRTRLIDTFA